IRISGTYGTGASPQWASTNASGSAAVTAMTDIVRESGARLSAVPPHALVGRTATASRRTCSAVASGKMQWRWMPRGALKMGYANRDRHRRDRTNRIGGNGTIDQ